MVAQVNARDLDTLGIATPELGGILPGRNDIPDLCQLVRAANDGC